MRKERGGMKGGCCQGKKIKVFVYRQVWQWPRTSPPPKQKGKSRNPPYAAKSAQGGPELNYRNLLFFVKQTEGVGVVAGVRSEKRREEGKGDGRADANLN